MRPFNKKEKAIKKRAQSLVEVMVAIMVISVVMVGVFTLIFSVLKFTVSTRLQTTAIGLTQYELYKIISEHSASLPPESVHGPDTPMPSCEILFSLLTPGTTWDSQTDVSGVTIFVTTVLEDVGGSELPSGSDSFMRLTSTASWEVYGTGGYTYTDSRLVRVKYGL